MRADNHPLQLLLLTVCGWVNQHQQDVVAYLVKDDCNAHAERFVGSIKSECLSRMIFFGERSLVRAVSEFIEHYHAERPHQGLGNELIERREIVGDGKVVCSERLGGILKSYRRAA